MELRAQELSSIAWSFANLRPQQDQLVEAISGACLARMKQMDAQGTCNVAWAFATFSPPNAPLLYALAERVGEAPKLNALDLTNLAWCFGVLDLPKEHQGWTSISGAAEDLINTFTQSLARTAGKGNIDRQFMRSLRDEMLSVVHAFANFSHLTDAVYRAALRSLTTAAQVLEGDTAGKPLVIEALRSGPSILLQQGDLYVLQKPPGWNVSVGYDEIDTPKVATFTRGQHVQDWLLRSASDLPVVQDAAAQHGILHRLDVNTSGVLLCSKTYLGYFLAQLQFVARKVQKYYVCLCTRHLSAPRMLQHPLLEGEGDAHVTSISKRGRLSRTELLSAVHLWHPQLGPVSLVQILLHTGRRHQIRAHLAYEGHPLVGDATYGGPEGLDWCPRTFLHASRLILDAELAGGRLDASCPLPEDLKAALKGLQAVDPRARAAQLSAAQLSAAQTGAARTKKDHRPERSPKLLMWAWFSLSARKVLSLGGNALNKIIQNPLATNQHFPKSTGQVTERNRLRLPRRSCSLTLSTLRALPGDGRPSFASLEALQAEVQRLRAELKVWQSTEGALARSHQAERDELSRKLKEQLDKASVLAEASRQAEPEEEVQRLEDEVAHLRAAQQRAQEQHRRVQEAESQTQEEFQLLRRRLEVERELTAAQEAQLGSLRETIAAVRQQVLQATRENTELRSTLASQQEILRQLRSAP
ncbi:unnamed protein product [Durusdinium trenchii]|uniref:Pseudouridine synthase RsuA/RluA-like domain-containing protein n=1 Tax=Durusdinium trenchii TaxID=1381693 RepID=A0ABP0SNP3_9DINO